jgi:predicted DNA-binding transcriptional regulator
MTDEALEDVLTGTTLKIYRLMLKKGNLGIREAQKILHLSSPSVAAYHLSKLERAGILKQEKGQYVVAKVVLRNLIIFRRMLIPKYFFILYSSMRP